MKTRAAGERQEGGRKKEKESHSGTGRQSTSHAMPNKDVEPNPKLKAAMHLSIPYVFFVENVSLTVMNNPLRKKEKGKQVAACQQKWE
jgi:hypothetical protein